MATRPNWGPGKHLKMMIFNNADQDALTVAVNAWLASLTQQTILQVTTVVDTDTTVFILYSTL